MEAHVPDGRRILAHVVDDLVRFQVGGAVGAAVVAIGVQVAVPLVARLEHLVGKLDGRCVTQAVAVDVDALVGPFAGQSELTPGADVLLGAAAELGMPGGSRPAAVPGRTEDAVELLQGDLRQRIVLVDDDHEVVLPAHVVVRAGESGEARRLVALQAEMAERVVEAGLVVDGDVRQPEVEAGNGDGRRRQVVLDLDSRLGLLERLLPPSPEGRVAEVVVAVDAKLSGGFFLRHVMRQAAQVELLRVGNRVGAPRHARLALRRGPGRKLARLLGWLRLVLRRGVLRHEDRREQERDQMFHGGLNPASSAAHAHRLRGWRSRGRCAR